MSLEDITDPAAVRRALEEFRSANDASHRIYTSASQRPIWIGTPP
jgi:hypothetical protein